MLATLEYLAESGLNPTVSCLKSGHSFLTTSGNVSEHSSGSAVDIAAINGIPILDHQDRGGITEQTVRRLMMLQGTMEPHQIISLLDLGQNTMALPDHYNHIHVGFHPLFGSNQKLGEAGVRDPQARPVGRPASAGSRRSTTRSSRSSPPSTRIPAHEKAQRSHRRRVTRDRGTVPAAFRFVQFEFGFLLGPADGRYLTRTAPDEEPGAGRSCSGRSERRSGG